MGQHLCVCSLLMLCSCVSRLISAVSQVSGTTLVCLFAFDAVFLCLDLISAVSQVSGATLMCLLAFAAVFFCLWTEMNSS